MLNFFKAIGTILSVAILFLLAYMAYTYTFTTGHGLMPEIALGIGVVLVYCLYVFLSYDETDCFEEDEMHDVTNNVFTKHN
jgi:Ca2+/Na+ antiporter